MRPTNQITTRLQKKKKNMTSAKVIALICGLLATATAQIEDPTDTLRRQDSVLFTQYDASEEKGNLEFAPADPNAMDLDGDILNSTVLIYTTEGFVAEYWGLTASYDDGKIWFNNYRRSSLLEYNVNTEEITTASKDRTDGLEDLAYDRVTKCLYWADSIEKKILATDPSNYKNFAVVWESSEVAPYAMAVHTTKRKLFFGVYKSEAGRISQSELIKTDLDGSNAQAIMNFPDVIRPRGLTIDFSGNADKLFWTDIDFTLESIVVACDLDGKLRRQFFSSPTGLLWDIANYQNYIYITDLINTTANEYSIYIREKNGRRGRTVKTKLRPRNIDIYAENEVSKVKVQNECENARCEHICLATGNGGYICKCSPGFVLVDGYRCETKPLTDDYLLICDIGQKRVFQMPLETSSYLVDSITALPWDDDVEEKIYAAAVDMKNGDHAYVDLLNERIVWGDRSIEYDEAVTSIVVDCCEERIYWTGNSEILSWDGRSSGYETVYALSFFSDAEIRQITIDCVKKRLYWVEYTSTTRKAEVKRSDLKGKDVETVLMNLPVSKGITIDYETYTLYVMTMLDGMLYALPLKLLEDKIPSTSPTYIQYDSTDMSAYFDSEVVVIWDIRVKNGYVYLADSEASFIRRYSIRNGPQSMERYGPMQFYFTSTLDFCDKQYYDRYIAPNCPGYVPATAKPSPRSRETTTTTTRGVVSIVNPTGQDCSAILESSSDFTKVLNAYIACIIAQMQG